MPEPDRQTITGIETALAEAGGVGAPLERSANLRSLLERELEHGARELSEKRSGYRHPVVVVFARRAPRGAVAVVPVPARTPADPAAASERAWLLTAAVTGALVEMSGSPGLETGERGPWLALATRADADPELAALAFDEHASAVDRLRARALALPAHAIGDLTGMRAPLPAAHGPLLVAAAVAHQGGRPADPASVAEHEEAILAAAEAAGVARPHEDPDPSRRVARRILQRLNGMGKWGGYHTEFSHLARGFGGNDKALAERVGEALLDAGLLAEKQSVGQRHVFLNPRRAGEIHRLIEDAQLPKDLLLPQ